MKKLLSLVFLTVVISACSVDDSPSTSYALLAIESVEIAATYPVNVESEIMVTYKRPTDCFIFDGFYVQSQGFSSIIAVQAVEMFRDDCLEDMSTFEIPFTFKPTEVGDYHFKFYAGSTGDVPEYIEYSVVVE